MTRLTGGRRSHANRRGSFQARRSTEQRRRRCRSSSPLRLASDRLGDMPRCFDVEKLKLTDFMIIHGARPTDTVCMTVGDANGKD